jgi:phage FluMu protein Com
MNTYNNKHNMACPWCKEIYDTLTQAAGAPLEKPQPNDIILCTKCGKLGIRLGHKDMRRPTYDEVYEAMSSAPLLFMAVVAWAAEHSKRK